MPTTFANTIDGHDIYAKRAECDAAGNDLSTTYATKSELPEGVPAVTSSDNNKVLKASYSGGVASYSWQPESGGGGGGGSYTAGTGIDITNDVISVDTSVVATQTDLADKEDAFTVGTGLEMDTTGGVNTLQVETPMDITAGPGIAIDNPDSDTLRVSIGTTFTQAQLNYLKAALGLDETELFSGTATGQTAINLSESILNFERVRVWIRSKSDVNNPVSIVEYPISSSDTALNIFLTDRFDTTWQWITWRFTYGITNNGTTITETSSAFGGSSSSNSWSAGANVHNQVVTKVVGIHRIANN